MANINIIDLRKDENIKSEKMEEIKGGKSDIEGIDSYKEIFINNRSSLNIVSTHFVIGPCD